MKLVLFYLYSVWLIMGHLLTMCFFETRQVLRFQSRRIVVSLPAVTRLRKRLALGTSLPKNNT